MQGRLELRQRLDELVAERQATPFPNVTPRSVEFANLQGKADVVGGMRRSGKTYRLFQHANALLQRGVARSQIFYLNFEDERLLPMEATDLNEILEALYRRTPQLRDGNLYVLFDEIQNVPGWDKFIRRLLDGGQTKVVITGSSAKLLSQEIATSLRGRSLSHELLPFSFGEVLLHQGIPVPTRWPPAPKARAVLEHAFSQYFMTGGFPEVQGLHEQQRIQVLQEYVDVAVYRDVVERHQATNLIALRTLVRRLTRNPARSFSVHKFHQELKSQGIAVAKDTLHQYLMFLEDAHLVFAVSLDGISESRRLVVPRKVYPIDHGLSRAQSVLNVGDAGLHLETIVYLELRRRGYRPGFHINQSGTEVDFVLRSQGGQVEELIQVCLTLSDSETEQRERRALEEAIAQTGAHRATVVTLSETGSLKLGSTEGTVVPAWRWLLEPNS